MYRSVSTRAVIGQFSGADSTLRPAEFKSLFQSPCKLPEIFALKAKIRAEKNSVRNLQYGPRTRLVRGIYKSFHEKKLQVEISYCLLFLDAAEMTDKTVINLRKERKKLMWKNLYH